MIFKEGNGIRGSQDFFIIQHDQIPPGIDFEVSDYTDHITLRGYGYGITPGMNGYDSHKAYGSGAIHVIGSMMDKLRTLVILDRLDNRKCDQCGKVTGDVVSHSDMPDHHDGDYCNNCIKELCPERYHEMHPEGNLEDFFSDHMTGGFTPSSTTILERGRGAALGLAYLDEESVDLATEILVQFACQEIYRAKNKILKYAKQSARDDEILVGVSTPTIEIDLLQKILVNLEVD